MSTPALTFFLGLVAFWINCCLSTIYTNTAGSYIGVYDDSNTYTWFEALSYCETVYGTSLASIHSSIDETNCNAARYDGTANAWIGLSDFASPGTWVWSDGTSYDFTISWKSGEPSNSGGNEDCVHFWYSLATFNDRHCTGWPTRQFICNQPTPRPTRHIQHYVQQILQLLIQRRYPLRLHLRFQQ